LVIELKREENERIFSYDDVEGICKAKIKSKRRKDKWYEYSFNDPNAQHHNEMVELKRIINKIKNLEAKE